MGPTGLAGESGDSDPRTLVHKTPHSVYLLACSLPGQPLLAPVAKEFSLPNEAGCQGGGLERGHNEEWAAGGGVCFLREALEPTTAMGTAPATSGMQVFLQVPPHL